MIPLQQEVDDILFIVARQVGKRRLKFDTIPDHSTVHLLWFRHATVRNHLVELGDPDADVSRSFLA
ncbi:hypothetical protein X737_35450 [Mesorhizobium sp. L48C026A00]|nr:hypothetical protein X737_35450 [Mesorhizobium sp. L48C026A00]